MIISFLSVCSGQTATTTNALSVGLCTALHYKLKVLLVSIQTKNDLMNYMTTKRMLDDGVNLSGTEDLLRLSKNSLLQPHSIKNYTTPILRYSLLDILPNFSFDEHNSQSINQFTSILEMAKSSYDVIILDAHLDDAQLYEEITSYSDALVLSISQNRQTIIESKEEFKRLSDLKPCFACVGRFEPSLKMNDKQLRKMLDVKELMTVNYNAKLVDILNAGNTLEYFGRFFYNEKLEQSNPYIKSVLKSTSTLLEALAIVK